MRVLLCNVDKILASGIKAPLNLIDDLFRPADSHFALERVRILRVFLLTIKGKLVNHIDSFDSLGLLIDVLSGRTKSLEGVVELIYLSSDLFWHGQ